MSAPALGQDERSLVPLYSIDDAITETRTSAQLPTYRLQEA